MNHKDRFRLVRPTPKSEKHKPEVAFGALIQRKIPESMQDFLESARHFELDAGLETVINTALAVGAPLLLTGDPGTGKTQVAWYLGWYFGIEVYDFQVKSTSTAIDLKYDFDAVAYLPHTRRTALGLHFEAGLVRPFGETAVVCEFGGGGDESGEEGETTLRGATDEINQHLQEELQERLTRAGVRVIEARISHLAYAPEIAADMLRRQQATAIVAARTKIGEGAVGMGEMALEELARMNVGELDEERKAAMVSNLLVVLCGESNAQPVVNAGTLYQ